MLEFKGLDWKVQGIDETHRKVEIYVAAFGNKDSDGDIIIPGAFTKTISENGPQSAKPRIKHFLRHWDSIGVPEEMTTDEKGLRVVSVLSNSTKGKDTIEDYKLNMFEHSIGYQVIQFEEDVSTETRILKEIKLWEYSSVDWGANENTPLINMKGYSSEEILKRINQKSEQLQTALRKGNYTDDRFEEIEYQLKVLTKSYNDYINSLKEPGPSTQEEPNFEKLVSVYDKIINSVK